MRLVCAGAARVATRPQRTHCQGEHSARWPGGPDPAGRRCWGGDVVVLLRAVEPAGYRSGAAGYVQPLEDMFQMFADCRFGDGQAARDLTVGVTGGDQSQQLPLPRGELRYGASTTPLLAVGVVEMGTEQHEETSLTWGEVRAGPAPEQQPENTAGPAGEAQHHFALHAHRPEPLAVHRGRVQFANGVEVRCGGNAGEVAGTVWVVARRAVPVVRPERLAQPFPVAVGDRSRLPDVLIEEDFAPFGVVRREREAVARDQLPKPGHH